MKKIVLSALIHAAAMGIIAAIVLGAIFMSKLTQEWIGGDQAMHTIFWLCVAFGVFGAFKTWADEDDQ